MADQQDRADGAVETSEDKRARKAAEKSAERARKAELKAARERDREEAREAKRRAKAERKGEVDPEEAARLAEEEKDAKFHRRTLHLFDTSVEIRTDQGERMWDVALEQALIERMGCNNTGYIAQVCPANDYNRFVLSDKGENFFGCSTDLTELPYFDVYRERARQLLARHIANAEYGLPLSVYERGYEHRLRDKPLERAEIEAKADERMEKIVAEASRDWAASCQLMRERYGDVYAEVFGPDAPRPAPHDERD